MGERLRDRLYLDFLLPDRLHEYDDLIERAAGLGYQFHTVGSFHAAKLGGTLEPRVLVLRCDVDTDPETARAKFEILKRHGARASFFFRLGTLDVELMRTMHAHGLEASYHFEEVAAVAKEMRLKTRAEVESKLPYIEGRFRENLTRLREETGLPMVSLAAHGDWINRRLPISNRRVLTPEVRRDLGIEVETYDAVARVDITSRFSDAGFPELWKPGTPLPAIERGDPTVYVLTHPRAWRRNAGANLRDDLRRVREEAAFRTPAWRS